MSAVAPTQKMTPAEYLAFERASPQKHQYWQGDVFNMSGASEQHVLITLNVAVALRTATREKGCRVYATDMRVKVSASGLYTYPDVIVTCQERRFEDSAVDTLLNPQGVFEVLSDSTESYDRGMKFEQYRKIPSLRHYVLLSQKQPLVEHFTRQVDDSWLLRTFKAGQTVTFDEPNLSFPVDELYFEVSFAALDVPPSGFAR